MNELVIQTHSFEKAKNQIKEFSMTKPEELALQKVDVDGGLFNWFDHKVTGQELNNLTNQVQGYLIKFNNLNTKFIEEFGEVYNALEALDKEYIQAILISIKAAEKASMEAKDAQKDINKTIEMQKQTIAVLKKFKDKIDKYEHLTSIDILWKDTQTFSEKIELANTQIEDINNLIRVQVQEINALNQFKEELNKYKHLGDIDQLWEDAQAFSKKFKSVHTQIENINNLIKAQCQEVEVLNQFKEELNKYKHLGDIDQLWEDAQTFSKEFKSVHTQFENINHSIKVQGDEIGGLNQFKKELSKHKHLRNIDQLWEDAQTFSEEIKSSKTQIENINNLIKVQDHEIGGLNQFKEELYKYKHLRDIDQLWEDSQQSKREVNSLQEKVEVLENQFHLAKQQMNDDKVNYEFKINNMFKKTKTAYFLAGGSIGLALIQFVLNILGIL
ncbi:MAG: hypothetical protein LPK00_13795 [Bacillaceae bacterium]|nr:hypothetical protein [Bacillaceae bacterium]